MKIYLLLDDWGCNEKFPTIIFVQQQFIVQVLNGNWKWKSPLAMARIACRRRQIRNDNKGDESLYLHFQYFEI